MGFLSFQIIIKIKNRITNSKFHIFYRQIFKFAFRILIVKKITASEAVIFALRAFVYDFDEIV